VDSPHRKPAALIVDDDLGFVYWLGAMFALSGCDVVPALSCRRAVSVVSTLGLEVDLIVVNPALIGVPKMLQKLSRVHRPKTVIIRDPGVEGDVPIPADATLDRPDIGSSMLRTEWVERIRGILRKLGVSE
jgi:hypothetical protein